MKRRLIALLLIAVCAFCLVSCGSEPAPNEGITKKDDDPQTDPTPSQLTFTLSFLADGTKVVPGTEADAKLLQAASKVYEIPSCAFDGNDTVYGYPSYEITVCNVNGKAVVYSVYFLEPDVSTPEGLALGDDEAKVFQAYGNGYRKDGKAYVYTDGKTDLSVIVENGAVVSIEYLMITG